MAQKVEIEIGIGGKDRLAKDFEDIRNRVGEYKTLIDNLKRKAVELTDKFLGSQSEVRRLNEELKNLAEGGAEADVLIIKTKELSDAQKKAANDAVAAMDANRKYWDALNQAGEDITEVQSRHLMLGQSYKEITESANQTNAILDEYTQRLKEVKGESDKTTESTDKLKKSTEKASKSSKGLADDISKVPGPLGDAAKGMKALTKETLVFLATPLGVTLAAISAGLALVSSWFHRTEEGEEAMNVATARFTGTLNTLLDVADDVGEWLYKAFTDPLGAIDDLWHSLEDKVLADMKRVAEMGAGVVKIFNGDVSGGLTQALSAWDGIGFGGIHKRAGENSEKQADIARRQNALDREQREWIVNREKVEARISELRAKVTDMTVKESEKAKAVTEAKILTNMLYNKEVKMAKEQYDIISETNRLSHSSTADKKKENEALAQTIRLERQRSDALRTLNRNESSLSNKAASAANKEKKKLEEDAKRRQKLFEINQEQMEEQAAKERELKDALTSLSIANENDNARREAMQMEKDHQDKVDAINRQAEEWKKAAYKAAEERFNATNTDKTKVFSDTTEGKAGWQGQGLTEDQDKIIKAQLDAENAIYSRYVNERYANERQATYDFLKTWGDYEQQKWAITQEYEEKIRKAASPTEAADLSLQRNEELKKLEADRLMDGIDWGGVFSDLQGHTQEYLIGLRDQLQAILNAGNLPVDQMATIQEKIREINGEINQQNGLLQFQGDRAREHKRLLQEEEDARKRLIDLQLEQTGNEYKVEEVTKKIRNFLSDAGLDSDTDIEDGLLSQFDPNSEQYRQAAAMLKNLRVAEGRLADSRKKTEKATAEAKNAEDKAKRSSAQAVADWFSDAQQFIAEKGIDQIPDLFDNLGLGSLGEKASQGLSAFNNAAGAAADFASGNYIGAATKALSAIKDVGNMLGIGGDSDKTLQKDIERLTAVNEVLTNAVSELAEKMDNATIIDAMKIYKDQIEYTKEARDNTKEMMWRSAHASSTGWLGTGIGSSSSSEWEINEALSSADWQRISKIVGRTVKEARDFFGLTSKEMYSVFLNASDIYAKIKNHADDGYADAAQFMDQYIEYWKELEELETAYYQKLTNTSFDSVRNQFKSSVMDMDSDQKTLAENFEKYMKDAIFESMMLENYDKPLKAWWKKFGDYMESGGTIDFDEQDDLRKEWDKWVAAALEERNRLYETMGWSADDSVGQQSASVSAMERITVDQANDIVGRMNAGQMLWQQGNNQRDIIIQNIAVMHEVVSGGGRHLGEVVELMQSANSHLSDIVEYNKKMLKDFGSQFEEIITQIKRSSYA